MILFLRLRLWVCPTWKKTNIVSAWQEPTEGTIWFNIYGSDEEINLDDIALEDQVIIVNELNSNYGFDKIYFVKDRSETQRRTTE